jgi:hypothetical protein
LSASDVEGNATRLLLAGGHEGRRHVHSYYVYTLQCFDGTFYVGVTNNLERPFAEHCPGLDDSC